MRIVCSKTVNISEGMQAHHTAHYAQLIPTTKKLLEIRVVSGIVRSTYPEITAIM